MLSKFEGVQFKELNDEELNETVELAIRLATDTSGAIFDERQNLARLVCELGATLNAAMEIAVDFAAVGLKGDK